MKVRKWILFIGLAIGIGLITFAVIGWPKYYKAHKAYINYSFKN